MTKRNDLRRDQIESWLLDQNAPTLLADGFDGAFIGVLNENDEPRAVYSIDKCIDLLVKGGMTRISAEEYFYFNVIGSYVGPQTPIFIFTIK